MTDPQTYLVTGGAGFIGSNFVHLLLRERPAARVVVLDAFTYAACAASLPEDERLTVVRGDIADADTVRSVFLDHKPDVVVNFAAESHVDRSIADPGVFVRTNVLGTQTLLDQARLSERLVRFVQVSTDEVYGSLPIDWPEGRVVDGRLQYGPTAFTECSPLSPRSPYSASKASADMMALAYAHTYGMNVTVTRCSNNYGPRQFPEKLIPLMVVNLLEGRQIPVYGDGLNVRDWLYVDDHCRAILAAVEHGLPAHIYNIGGHNERTNLQIVHTVIDAVRRHLQANPTLAPNVAPDSINRSRITFVTDRPGHDRRYAIDPAVAVSELGWQPQVPFEQGIEQTVEWYLTNPQWLNSVRTGEYRRFCSQLYGDLAK